MTHDNHYIDVEGSYYPDYFEENGVYFVSINLLLYLRQKLNIGEIEFNHIGFMSEDRCRVEEYCLLVPPVVNCIKKETAVYEKSGRLTYFEIDEEKTGDLEVVRIKGFPHIIVVDKLNRIDYAGYECTRLENFLNYKDERDRSYQATLSGEGLKRAVAEYERRAQGPANSNYFYGMRRVLSDEWKTRREIREGLMKLINSYSQSPISTEFLYKRYFLLNWSLDNCCVTICETQASSFDIHEFPVESMRQVQEFIAKLPEELRVHALREAFAVVLNIVANTFSVFETYENIHGNERFRWYLNNHADPSVNPPMVYDYKSKFQREVEAATHFAKFDFTGKDLREFDFSGKDLSGIKFEGCNLRRARFCRAILRAAKFTNCLLIETDFQRANLNEAYFVDNDCYRTNFNSVEMQGAQIKGSNLCHCSFIKTNLKGLTINNLNLVNVYFYKSTLQDAKFEISERLSRSAFRLCDLWSKVY